MDFDSTGCGDPIMSDYSTTLFARPSFIEGVARLWDFGNTLQEYNRSASPNRANFESLATDYEAVGMDARQAIADLRRELALSK